MTQHGSWCATGAALTLAVGLFCSPLGLAQEYSVTDLGALQPDWQSIATGINNAGQVGAVSESSTFEQYRAARYSGGQLQDLGTLGGELSETLAINDAGQVVGDATTTSDPLSYHAFLWDNGTMKDLGLLPGGNASQAWGVNIHSEVVGQAITQVGAAFVFHAFHWANNHMTDISPGELTNHLAEGINAGGLIVGTRDPGASTAKALLWNNGQMIDLNTLVNPPVGATLQSARAINDTGQIAGDAHFANGAFHSYRFDQGHVVEIGTDPNMQTRAFAINAAGDVVGDFAPADPYYFRAYRFHAGQMTDLNTLIPQGLGIVLTNAMGINDHGAIVCDGRVIDDFLPFHAYLLRPRTPGDLNCDGVVSFADINPFVVALIGQAQYQAAFPSCLWLNADVNGDGTVNFADINPFVALLTQ